MRRRSKIILGIVASLPVLAVLLAVVALPRIDLAPLVAGRASAALGRQVTIESLRVAPGLTLGVAIRGARLANIEGGSAPAMAELARAEARLDLLSLLTGGIVVHALEVEGFTLLLERSADRHANWHFGDRPATPAPRTAAPPDRSGLPMVHDLRISGSEVIFRTTGGLRLRARIDTAGLTAAAPEAPAALRAQGSYNDVAVMLEAALGSFAQLRDARTPFPIALRATAEATALLFEGTATDPLNVDGLDGQLSIAASAPFAILAMAGAGERAGPNVPFELTGHAVRNGDLWRVTDATGTLDGAAFTAPLIELTEGSAGQPDTIVARIAFAHLDVNRLLGPPPAEGAQAHGDADIPLVVPAVPDPLLHIEASAHELIYARLRGTDARAKLDVARARVTLQDVAVMAFGAHISGSAELVPAAHGTQVTAGIQLRQGELDSLRRAFGLRDLPLSGRISADVAARAEAATVNAATRNAHISAVIGMTGGTIAREVIEMASTDIRALLRSSEGTTPIHCLLAAVDIDAGRGRAAPLRIRAGTGTISGLATFDLNRERLDLIIGSQSETTHFFALDIPVHVSGSFAAPHIAPAEWSQAARERMARNEMAPLPPHLLEIARHNPCYVGHGLRR